jgi:hypothetical protein
MHKVRGLLTVLIGGLVIAGLTPASGVLNAQSRQLEFILSAVDASGAPVTDIKAEEVVMAENGAPGTIVKIEPFRIPVKLTVGIDNGPTSREAIAHYRTGLTGLVETLPPDVEVTIITTAPQPRTIVRATTDREQILKGVNGFAPENGNPRFTDTIVEFSQRLEREVKEKKVFDSLPILLMVSTAANEQTSYQATELNKALGVLAGRKARLMVVLSTTQLGNTDRQALIGIPATKATRGRYEAVAVSSRLSTLLPEFGKDIAALNARHVNQFKVTVDRANGRTGPIQNPTVEITRAGLQGTVSLDGLP